MPPKETMQELYGPTELWPILEEFLDESRHKGGVSNLAGTLKGLYGPTGAVAELDKHKPAIRDDSRLKSLTIQDGCFCFDGISIPHTTARAFCVPQLLNDTADTWNKQELDRMVLFIRRMQYTFQHCLGRMFHYTILYLVQSLAQTTSCQVGRSNYKPAFTPASRWTGRDTYCAMFLWVASIYHNPEREQQVPTWNEFSQITGLDRYEQWQYLEHMKTLMLWNKDLSDNVIMMARHGYMHELPIKIGEAWWDGILGQNERVQIFQRLERNRMDWPARRLPVMSSTATEEERFAGLLPGTRREYCGDPNKMGYRGPVTESSELPKPSVPRAHNDQRWTGCIPSELYGLPVPPITRRTSSKMVDKKKRWYKTEVWRGPTTMY